MVAVCRHGGNGLTGHDFLTNLHHKSVNAGDHKIVAARAREDQQLTIGLESAGKGDAPGAGGAHHGGGGGGECVAQRRTGHGLLAELADQPPSHWCAAQIGGGAALGMVVRGGKWLDPRGGGAGGGLALRGLQAGDEAAERSGAGGIRRGGALRTQLDRTGGALCGLSGGDGGLQLVTRCGLAGRGGLQRGLLCGDLLTECLILGYHSAQGCGALIDLAGQAAHHQSTLYGAAQIAATAEQARCGVQREAQHHGNERADRCGVMGAGRIGCNHRLIQGGEAGGDARCMILGGAQGGVEGDFLMDQRVGALLRGGFIAGGAGGALLIGMGMREDGGALLLGTAEARLGSMSMACQGSG